MKYKNEDDNRYRVQFMRATEQLMDKLSVKAFIFYLKTNAEFEDYDYIRVDGKQARVGVYDLKEEGSTLHKDFAVTEDDRVFFLVSLNYRAELVDREKIQSSKANQKKHTEPFRVTIFPNQDGKKDFYFNSYAEAMAFAKAKVNNHIVFLLEHMIDGMYNIVTEVKEDDEDSNI